MKKINLIITIIFVISTIIITEIPIYADSSYVNNNKEEIIDYFNNHFLEWANQLVDGFYDGENADDINYDNLFRAYRFKSSDNNPFNEEHSSLKEITNLNDDIWIFNVFETGHQLIIGKNEQNKWYVSMDTAMNKIESENNPDTDYSLAGIIDNIKKYYPNYDEESLFFIWDYSLLQGDTIAVFTEGDQEYAAYYFVDKVPGEYQHGSGEIVESSEVIRYLNEINGTTSETERNGELLYGGKGKATSDISTDETPAKTNIALYIGIASAILIVSIALVVNKRHTKKNKSV